MRVVVQEQLWGPRQARSKWEEEGIVLPSQGCQLDEEDKSRWCKFVGVVIGKMEVDNGVFFVQDVECNEFAVGGGSCVEDREVKGEV